MEKELFSSDSRISSDNVYISTNSSDSSASNSNAQSLNQGLGDYSSSINSNNISKTEESSGCEICYEISDINIFTCFNNHMICAKCYDLIKKANNPCCPFCRDKTLFTKRQRRFFSI